METLKTLNIIFFNFYIITGQQLLFFNYKHPEKVKYPQSSIITIVVVRVMISVEGLFGAKTNSDQQKLLKVVSRNGVSDILFSLEKRPQRFSQLMFETKLNPGILDRHLKALAELNIVSKNSETYELTDTGRRLILILQQLFRVLK